MTVAADAVDHGDAGVFCARDVHLVGGGIDRDDRAEAGWSGGGRLTAAGGVLAVAAGAVDDRDGAWSFAVGEVCGVDRVRGGIDRDPGRVGLLAGRVVWIRCRGVDGHGRQGGAPQPDVTAASHSAPLMT